MGLFWRTSRSLVRTFSEKQDLTEEQVRLNAHLNYFILTIKTDYPNGKKLGFIGQEIGREINTIG